MEVEKRKMYEIDKWTSHELVDWKTNKEVRLTVNPLDLSGAEGDGLLNSVSIDPEETDEGIDATEIKFSAVVKNADKLDYTVAVISGLIAATVNYKMVGDSNFDENIDFSNPKEALPLLEKIWKMCGCVDKDIKKGETHLNDIFDNAERKIHRAPEFKSLAKDFARGLSYKALLCSIIEQLAGIRFGLDENGAFTIHRMPEEARVYGFNRAVYVGFLTWITAEAYAYKNTGKYEEEVKDIIKFPAGMKKIKELIKEISQTNLFKNKSFDSEKLDQWVINRANSIEWDDDNTGLGTILVRQAIPVTLNKSLVRTYYFLKTFVQEIKRRDVKSIEGLAFVNLNDESEEKDKVIARMDAVSSGVFAAINISHAAVKGVKRLAEEDGDKAKAAAVFAAGINFVNLFEFVAVVRTNAAYFANDIQEMFKEHGSLKVTELEPVNREILEKYTGLNKVETQLLYSLELQEIKEDIARTKKNDDQIKKDEWEKVWKETSKESVGLSKLFFEDKEKTYSALTTHAASGANNDWLYRVILELSLFKPYYPLNIDDYDNKQFKHLKQTRFDYVKDIFAKSQEVIEPEEIEELLKAYQKQYDYLDGKTGKTAAGIAGAVAVGAITAGAAFVFAPAIAVALVGGGFSGIYGAALTNACLAVLGGGALSAGGLGMAGGALVIAGGGAVLGLGASGAATATALMLLSSPEYVKVDYAKLLTNCEYVMIDKYRMFSEVEDIRKIVRKDYEDLGIRLGMLEEKISQSVLHGDDLKAAKHLVKSITESRKIMERAISALDRMLTPKVLA